MHVTLGSVEALDVLDPRSALSGLGALTGSQVGYRIGRRVGPGGVPVGTSTVRQVVGGLLGRAVPAVAGRPTDAVEILGRIGGSSC
jgi:hypothetical protein